MTHVLTLDPGEPDTLAADVAERFRARHGRAPSGVCNVKPHVTPMASGSRSRALMPVESACGSSQSSALIQRK